MDWLAFKHYLMLSPILDVTDLLCGWGCGSVSVNAERSNNNILNARSEYPASRSGFGSLLGLSLAFHIYLDHWANTRWWREIGFRLGLLLSAAGAHFLSTSETTQNSVVVRWALYGLSVVLFGSALLLDMPIARWLSKFIDGVGRVLDALLDFVHRMWPRVLSRWLGALAKTVFSWIKKVASWTKEVVCWVGRPLCRWLRSVGVWIKDTACWVGRLARRLYSSAIVRWLGGLVKKSAVWVLRQAKPCAASILRGAMTVSCSHARTRSSHSYAYSFDIRATVPPSAHCLGLARRSSLSTTTLCLTIHAA